MKPLFALTAVALLAACENGQVFPDLRGTAPTPAAADAVPAPTFQASDRDRLIGAIASNGCAISPENVAPILTQASISADQLKALMLALEADGTLTQDSNDTLRLDPAQCI